MCIQDYHQFLIILGSNVTCTASTIVSTKIDFIILTPIFPAAQYSATTIVLMIRLRSFPFALHIRSSQDATV